ncbi:MAG: choline ABC transporter ATP-binding protein, partial [Geminicoccaceae bacterium]|nr:choline ABC transporter ATP-binding protein [Geminicoccaceae bacterium]
MAFRRVDVVFGSDAAVAEALRLLDEGEGREEIIEATGAVVGVAGAELAIQPGEICVLMGLSGSGKSTLL